MQYQVSLAVLCLAGAHGGAACLAAGMAACAASAEPAGHAGIRPGMGYAQARSSLLADGWQPDGDRGAPGRPPAYRQFPEVVCGQGRDALCSGRFIRAGDALLLILDRNTKEPAVTFVDRD